MLECHHCSRVQLLRLILGETRSSRGRRRRRKERRDGGGSTVGGEEMMARGRAGRRGRVHHERT